MLKLGEKIINQIYLGDKKIAKVFFGEKLVYQSEQPIFLQSAIFDGACCVDTGISHQTCRIETRQIFYETGTRQLMGFGLETASYWGASASGTFDYFLNTNALDWTDVVLEFNTEDETAPTLTVMADEQTKTTVGAKLGVYTYKLGGVESSSSTLYYAMQGEIAYNKFYIGGELVQDLRPCIDAQGVVCFYDMVTRKYFYNQGTGTLKAGNIIKFVDYISFDGASYISTGIPYQTCRLETTVKFSSDSQRMLSGWSDQAGCYWGMSSSGFLEVGGSIYATGTNLRELTTVKASLDATNKTITASVGDSSISRTGISSSRDYYIGCTITSSKLTIIGEVYGHKFWNEQGKLIKNLRPCVVAGEAGFYDMVTGKIFTNSGTGTLKPSGRFVSSILFDGASYIDTGYKHQTCKIECTIRFEETGTRQLMGFGASTGQYWGKGANSSTIEYFNGTNILDKTDVVLEYNCDNPTAPYLTTYADGKTRVGAPGSAMTGSTYSLGCISASTTKYWCTCEVWGQKFYIGGVLVQDLRPYVDDDGVACFKDIVTGEIFYNKGTGTLGYTE